MANLIRIKRGTQSAVETSTPVEGELLYATDTKKLFVGDGSTAGGVAIGLWQNVGVTDDISYSDGDVHIGADTDPNERLEVTGNVRINGQGYSAQHTETPAGTTQTIDWDNSGSQVLNLGSATGDVTVDFSNNKTGASYVLKVLQGSTARDIIWDSSVVWLGNEPTLSDEEDGFNVLTFYFDGANLIGTGDANIKIFDAFVRNGNRITPLIAGNSWKR